MAESSYTVAPAPQFRITERDRYSMLSVIVLTLLALLAGYLLREAVQSRTRSVQGPAGVQVSYPDTWQADTSDPNVLRISDAAAGGTATTFEVTTQVVAQDAEDADALASAANNLALTRGQDMDVFRMFGVQTGQSIKGLPGAKSTYSFVQVPQNVFREHLPAVMLGQDYLVRKGNTVYVFSVHSTEENQDEALDRFERFVESARLP